MRGNRANYNVLSISANAMETAINTEQTLDTALLVAIGDLINIDPRTEDNSNEANGLEEADQLYRLGGLASATLNFEKAPPQAFAAMYAYALGVISTSAAGSGYQHTITPIADDLDNQRSNPSFTASQRYGNTIMKRLFASMFVDSLTATFAKDAWCKLSAGVKGTGKVTNSVTEETVTAAENATELTLAANGVDGSTAAARLDSIHRIRVELESGQWTEVAFSAVSDATPAVITITAPAGTTDTVNYKILYVPAGLTWTALPSYVEETPLRVSQMNFILGGAWTGSAFVGGKTISSEINTVEHTLSNNLQIEFTPGASGLYASRCFRDGRVQALKLDRDFRDYIVQNYLDQDETFGCRILAQGAEFDTGHNFEVEMIFPMLGVLNAPLSANGKRLAEAGDFRVLQDSTYGSVIVRVKNEVSAYMA